MRSWEKRLLDEFQHNFPIEEHPYSVIAERLGVTEDEVLDALRSLCKQGIVTRVGPVFRPHRVGVSLLVAMQVPADDLERVAAIVSAHPAVNHNYEREHIYNLWFVVTARNEAVLKQSLDALERATGYPCLRLPLEEEYHINLGFRIAWN